MPVSIPAWNGVETRGQAPYSEMRGESIVQTPNAKAAAKAVGVSYQLAEKYPLPQGSGQQITFNGFNKLGAASSTLSEYAASANSAVTLSSRKVNVSIVSYGRTVKLTDLLEQTSILNVNEGALREIEDSAARTQDNALQRAVFKNVLAQVGQNADAKAKILSVWMSSVASAFCANTSTTSYNANSNQQFGLPAVMAASTARLSAVSSTAPSISARLGPIGIRKTVARLRRLNVDTFADGKFVAVAHPYALATMMGNSDWKQWNLNYQGGSMSGPTGTMYKHEVATVHQVRFLESNNSPRYAVAAHSVNITAILGQGCLACTELGGSIQYIITRPGPQTTSDPFHLASYVSFKQRIVGAILNPSAGAILFSHERL